MFICLCAHIGYGCKKRISNGYGCNGGQRSRMINHMFSILLGAYSNFDSVTVMAPLCTSCDARCSTDTTKCERDRDGAISKTWKHTCTHASPKARLASQAALCIHTCPNLLLRCCKPDLDCNAARCYQPHGRRQVSRVTASHKPANVYRLDPKATSWRPPVKRTSALDSLARIVCQCRSATWRQQHRLHVTRTFGPHLFERYTPICLQPDRHRDAALVPDCML